MERLGKEAAMAYGYGGDRRQFMKGFGLAAISVPAATVVGGIGGYGGQADPHKFWEKSRFVHIKE